MYRPTIKKLSINKILELNKDEYYLSGYTYYSFVDIYIKDKKWKHYKTKEDILLIFNNLSLPLKIAKTNNFKKLHNEYLGTFINWSKLIIFIDEYESFLSDYNKIYTLEFIEGISIVPSWTNNSLYSSYESSIEKCDKGIKDIIDSYKLMEELHES